MTNSACNSLVDEIIRTANDAEKSGDSERAARLREHARRLQVGTFGFRTTEDHAEQPPTMLADDIRHRVAAAWRSGHSVRVEHVSSALLIDFAPNSTIAISSNSILMSGAAVDDARAQLLTALHAKEHWGGRMVVSGNAMFCMKAAVANELVGVETVDYIIPERLRPLANALRREWQVTRDQLGIDAAPSHPEAHAERRSSVHSAATLQMVPA